MELSSPQAPLHPGRLAHDPKVIIASYSDIQYSMEDRAKVNGVLLSANGLWVSRSTPVTLSRASM